MDDAAYQPAVLAVNPQLASDEGLRTVVVEKAHAIFDFMNMLSTRVNIVGACVEHNGTTYQVICMLQGPWAL